LDSDSQPGIHTIDLTPSIYNNDSPEQACYRWYIMQPDDTETIGDVINSCPPSLSLLKEEEMAWKAIQHTKLNISCYSWEFAFINGKL